MPEIVLAQTAREKILQPYIDAKIPHEFRSTPISSVSQFKADYVSNTSNGTSFGFLYFAPQKVRFFRKGDGDQIDFGSIKVDSTEAESNLQRGGSTDGARDMAIEGIQITSLGALTKMAEPFGFGQNPTHEGVVRALQGAAVLCDPFSLIVPSQLQSPFLLEDALFRALMSVSSLSLELDTSRPFKLGGARLYPGSAGQTMLHASGLPDASNVFPIKEGILWKRDGKSDSDLKLTLELHREVVVPITNVTPPGGNTPIPPANVYQRVAIDLLGVSVSELGDN